MKHIIRSLVGCAMLVCAGIAHAELTVKVDEPKRVGQKAVIKLTMKNTFKEKVESARAEVFLLEEQGKVVAQAAHWFIGGTKDKPALSPDKETIFNFVIQTDKPFAKTKVSFSRVVLEGGELADVNKDVTVKSGK